MLLQQVKKLKIMVIVTIFDFFFDIFLENEYLRYYKWVFVYLFFFFNMHSLLISFDFVWPLKFRIFRYK